MRDGDDPPPVAGHRLLPTAGVEDAPIGGIFVIDVESEGDAFSWAHRAPSIAWGPVEVREVQTVFRDGEWHAAS